MKEIFDLLLKAHTVKAVTDVLEELTENIEVDWLPVGGFKDNVATINMGTDPAAGLAERITNAIDAIIELEWQKNGKPADLESPRIASEKWFNIPHGRLNTIDDATDKRISELAKKIKVTLRD